MTQSRMYRNNQGVFCPDNRIIKADFTTCAPQRFVINKVIIKK